MTAIMARAFLLIGFAWVLLIVAAVVWLVAGYDVLGLLQWGGLGTGATFPAGMGLWLAWSAQNGREVQS